MQPLAGAASWAGNSNVGRFWLRLHTDHSWIIRRIETVSLLDLTGVERHTTLDIDALRIRELATEYSLGHADSLVVPLVLLDKNLHLDIDVRDEAGAAIPVCASDRDSSAAELLMLAHVESLVYDMSTISDTISQKLFDIAQMNPSDHDRATLNDSQKTTAFVEAWRLEPSLTVSQSVVDKWLTLFDNDVFTRLIIAFTLQYMLMVPLSLTDKRDVRIIKFRLVESGPEPSSERTWLERLGVAPFLYLVEAPAIGRSERDHFRLLAPPGTFLESTALIEAASEALSNPRQIVPAVTSNKYSSRITPERALVYSRRLPERQYAMMVAIRPLVTAFVTPALIAVTASLALLASGLIAQALNQALTNGTGSTEAAIALLLLFPSLISAYVVREGEHEVLRYLLFYLRCAVVLCAGATVAAGVVIVLEVPSRYVNWIWGVAGALNLIVAGFLATVRIVSMRNLRVVRSHSDRTSEIRLIEF